MIILRDWRDEPADVIGRLYDSECARWYGSLGWDYRPSCGLIEAARLSGRLRGFLARDGRSTVVGWAYFLLHQDTLQIGNLIAPDAAVARSLVERIVNAAEARRARRYSCFLFPLTGDVEHCLAAAGFSILRHSYRRLALADCPATVPDHRCIAGRNYAIRDWTSQAIPDLVCLFSEAYEGSREARCFAPDGQMEQWANYVHHLLHTPACGRFDRRLSAIVETANRRLAGAILVTGLSDRTAHVAQMAVHRGHQGCGLGEWLVRVACQRAGRTRYREMSLLVAQSNGRARRLYDRAGFEEVSQFLFADRERVPG